MTLPPGWTISASKRPEQSDPHVENGHFQREDPPIQLDHSSFKFAVTDFNLKTSFFTVKNACFKLNESISTLDLPRINDRMEGTHGWAGLRFG